MIKTYVIAILFFVWILLIIYLLYVFKIQATKIKEAYLFSNYNEQYKQKLLSSVKKENDEYYARLRHDIYNYIQTKETMKQNKTDN